MIRTHFPKIWEFFFKSIENLIKKDLVKKEEVFAHIFLQFCPNIPLPNASPPVNSVFCKPHIDSKNIALGLCLLLVYSRSE
jgi:hypothetical protein